MKILISTVQYKAAVSTVALLESIAQARKAGTEVYVSVVDTGASLDDSEAQGFENLCVPSGVKYVPSENIGYFPGLNLGVRAWGGAKNFDYIIGCNNDVEFDELFFERLSLLPTADFRKNVIVPRILGSDGKDQNPQYSTAISLTKRIFFFLLYLLPSSVGRLIHDQLFTLLGRKEMTARLPAGLVPPRVAPVFLPLGAIFVLGSDVYEKLNGFPEDSFLYNEELFLRRSLRSLGLEFMLVFSLVVRHTSSISTGNLSSKEKWALKRYSFKKIRWFYLFGR